MTSPEAPSSTFIGQIEVTECPAFGDNQACLGSDPVTISGVAPKAYVMSYRVFYNSITNDGSFYNTEGIKALEDIVMDGADVLNNSWGGGPGSIGGEFDALDQALINAVNAGVFVSMSNGNAGPNTGTGDHPSADYINVAASSTTGTFGSGRFNVTAPVPVPATLQNISFAMAGFGAAIPAGTVLGPFSYLPAAVANPANALGCNAWPADTFAGKAAVIVRGTCEFGLKALNAEKAGAVFVVIYNSAAGGDALLNMGAGVVGGQVTIPAIAVGRTKGLAIDEWYKANPGAAQFALDTKGFQAGNTPDIIADFSSRGPGVGNVLKPDIAAPGVNILAQGYGPGTGEERHLGFGQASGTSMAAPHVTGAAALIKQIHPDWSPAWIKSALMSTVEVPGYLHPHRRAGPTAGHGRRPPRPDQCRRPRRHPRSAEPQLRRSDPGLHQDHRGQGDQRCQRSRDLRAQHPQHRDGLQRSDDRRLA